MKTMMNLATPAVERCSSGVRAGRFGVVGVVGGGGGGGGGSLTNVQRKEGRRQSTMASSAGEGPDDNIYSPCPADLPGPG